MPRGSEATIYLAPGADALKDLDLARARLACSHGHTGVFDEVSGQGLDRILKAERLELAGCLGFNLVPSVSEGCPDRTAVPQGEQYRRHPNGDRCL